jgi:aryl-alcohol dehydrogenase-like predicted oxidoreductase
MRSREWDDDAWFFAHRMLHHVEELDEQPQAEMVSIYEPADLGHLFGRYIKIVQLPYSLLDQRFGPYLSRLACQGIKIHARSIFLRGRCLEKATPQECIQFVLSNPYIDKVILGVDSLEQLKSNLDFRNSMEEHDLNIIDPRRWKNE